MRARALLALLTALVSAPAVAAPADVPGILDAAGFKGFAMVADANRILWQTPRAACPQNAPGGDIILCHPRDPAFQRWPWASVTKQVLAVLVMKQVDVGKLALDTPASAYLPALGPAGGAPTVRQLLQHRAGLRNPEDSLKSADGTPSWYLASDAPLAWCLAGRGAPGGEWRYNNCDSLVLGALLRRVTGLTVEQLFERDLKRPLGLSGTAFARWPAPSRPSDPDTAVAITPAEQKVLARFGAAGGLLGTPLDLLAIDRALLGGRLLSPAARDEMWKGDPTLGFMGLAQWSFAAPLKGCAKPVRIIERRGGIGRFQVRNLILPESNRILILFTADEKFDFGEIWEGKGLSHDLLSATACGASD
nr:serine hydrolase domain-containing protein [uncultured Sphingomonas sp.]